MQGIDGQYTPQNDAPGTVGTVIEEAKAQARTVADTAAQQTKGVFASIGSDLSAQAHSQKLLMAKGLDGFSNELDEVALNGTGRVPTLAGEAADRTRTLSRWLENTETADMVRSVEDFGRRRPVVFILGGVVAGLIAGRLTRGMLDDGSSRDDSTDITDPASAGNPVDVGTIEALDGTGTYPTVTSPVGAGIYGAGS